MQKLNNLEKREIRAGGVLVTSIGTALMSIFNISQLIMSLCKKYQKVEEIPPPPPLLPYSPDSPAAHEQWIKMQEMEQARFNPEYRISN